MPKHFLVTDIPPGEAPLWVRERWVGLSLPLARDKTTASSVLTSGVLSGPRGFLSCLIAFVTGKMERASGFAVETRAAFAVLEVGSPEALTWWRENTPHLFRAKKYFLFHANVGRIVEAPAGASQEGAER